MSQSQVEHAQPIVAAKDVEIVDDKTPALDARQDCDLSFLVNAHDIVGRPGKLKIGFVLPYSLVDGVELVENTLSPKLRRQARRSWLS